MASTSIPAHGRLIGCGHIAEFGPRDDLDADFEAGTLRYKAHERFVAGWSTVELLWFSDTVMTPPGDDDLYPDGVFLGMNRRVTLKSQARGIWSW
jgi:hypothetical protein